MVGEARRRRPGFREPAEVTASALADATFHALVQHGSDVIVLLDADTRVTWVSPSVERLLGYPPAPPPGGSPLDVLHPEDRARAEHGLARLLQPGGDTEQVVVRARHADGSYRWVEVIASNRLGDPAIGSVVLNCRDVTNRTETERALAVSESRFRTLAAAAPLVIYSATPDGRITYMNERWAEISGAPVAEALGHGWTRFVHPDDIGPLVETMGRDTPGVDDHTSRLRLVRADGDVRWVNMRTASQRDAGGDVIGHVGTLEDVTDETAAQRRLLDLAAVLDATPDIVTVVDVDFRTVYANQAARRFFGVADDTPADDIDPFVACTDETFERLLDEVGPAIDEYQVWRGEMTLRAADGRECPFLVVWLAHARHDGSVERLACIARDISEGKAFEAELQRLAVHDRLTGLPNRALFLDRLNHALRATRREPATLAVLFVDLDDFKSVNDTLGHDAGDDVLVAVARRLANSVRTSDTVARFGGDEFAVLCEDITGLDDAVNAAERTLQALRAPFAVGRREIAISASVGIAVSEGPGTRSGTLLRDADAAMYRAKELGRGRHAVFDERLAMQLRRRHELEEELRAALARGELRVLYQPEISLDEGRLVGVEALVRWQHPARGLLEPADFLPVAEASGLAAEIDAWVVRTALGDWARWTREGRVDPAARIAVNLSTRHLNRPDVPSEILGAAVAAGVDPACVCVEVTERALHRRDDVAGQNVRQLRELGIKVAVDDFGTGPASLRLLQQVPVDVLKVDRCLVAGVQYEPEMAAVTAAVIRVARSLGVMTVAEAVEEAGDLAVLRGFDCDAAQGRYFSAPLEPDQLIDLVDRRWSPPAR